MKRFTNRIRNHVEVVDVTGANNRLADLEDLQDDIGCPLEVRLKVTCDTEIYGASGEKYTVDYVYKDHFACHNENFGTDYEFDFSWWEYKTVWSLKEDKSE